MFSTFSAVTRLPLACTEAPPAAPIAVDAKVAAIENEGGSNLEKAAIAKIKRPIVDNQTGVSARIVFSDMSFKVQK